ncbi:MAG: zinc ribbon domain-containing protein [Armatimonadetes bacterium]|nr:zinc ribbon domain-containing protein [Armatimonadota bacterium]
MPVYEFRCDRCGCEFEELVSWRDLEEGKVQCPQCNSKEVRRKLSLFAARSTKNQSRGSSCGPVG